MVGLVAAGLTVATARADQDAGAGPGCGAARNAGELEARTNGAGSRKGDACRHQGHRSEPACPDSDPAKGRPAPAWEAAREGPCPGPAEHSQPAPPESVWPPPGGPGWPEPTPGGPAPEPTPAPGFGPSPVPAPSFGPSPTPAPGFVPTPTAVPTASPAPPSAPAGSGFGSVPGPASGSSPTGPSGNRSAARPPPSSPPRAPLLVGDERAAPAPVSDGGAPAGAWSALRIGRPALPLAFGLPADLLTRLLRLPAVPFIVGLNLFLLVILFTVWMRRRLEARRIRSELAALLGLPAKEVPELPPAAGAAMLAAVAAYSSRTAGLRRQVIYDDLTGVYRRAPGMAALARDVARCKRALLAQLAVAFVDVDGLKKVNDSAGHAAGDELLKSVAGALHGRVRAADLVFRYGGDEFVCVFPDQDMGTAVRVMTEIRDTVAGRLGREAFSFGIATLRPDDSAESLVARADAALYAARRARHDR